MKTILFLLTGTVFFFLPSPENIPRVRGEAVIVIADRDTTTTIQHQEGVVDSKTATTVGENIRQMFR